MKRLILPFLSLIALHSATYANIDPKVSEICLKAEDFQGCVESFSGQKEKKLSNKSDFDNALEFFKEGDSLEAIRSIDRFLGLNPDSKEGYILSAFINTYDLSKFDEAMDDIDIAIDIDDKYAYPYALKASVFYFELGGSFSKSLKYLQKGLELSPDDPYINLIAGDIQFDNGFVVLGGDTNNLSKKPKDIKALSLESFENAKKSFEKTLTTSNLDTYKNPLFESGYVQDVSYLTNALLGDTNFELYFLYKDKKERSTAKNYLEEALEYYTKAISISPSQEEVIKIELDRDMDLYSPAELYFYRGNAYSWMNKDKQACSDWKVSKKLGNADARAMVKDWRC